MGKGNAAQRLAPYLTAAHTAKGDLMTRIHQPLEGYAGVNDGEVALSIDWIQIRGFRGLPG